MVTFLKIGLNFESLRIEKPKIYILVFNKIGFAGLTKASATIFNFFWPFIDRVK